MFKFSVLTFLTFVAVADGFQVRTAPFVNRRALVSPLKATVEQATEKITGVEYTPSTHRLYYVPSVPDIADSVVGTPAKDFQDVEAYQLENDVGVKVKAMKKGANMVELLDRQGVNYVWENIEGACYYGQGSNNFPLTRGLILNGGVRFAAVTAEHGLYYDIDWDVTIDKSKPDEKSIIFSIVDNEANRKRARDLKPEKPANASPTPEQGFSYGQFNHKDINGNDTPGYMTRYPTTNMEFQYKITLRKGEDFVRLRMSVKNPGTSRKQGEAWLPMTFPIKEDSMILSHQELRWRRDNWCFDYMTPNVVKWSDFPEFDIPLKWPTGGIFYDFPRKNGRFHGVTTDPANGKGVVYYAPDDITKPGHYTKMWSWGMKDGPGASDLTTGRPASEYYEPWSSGTNFAFFQTCDFEPKKEISWEIAILPIESGLTGSDKQKLLDAVDTHIDLRMHQLGDIPGVESKDV